MRQMIPGQGPLCAYETVLRYGADILSSPGMQLEKACLQHGHCTVYGHSVRVAVLCVALAQRMRLRVSVRSLVRGALLHDYFLYDWHVPDKSHRAHGFRHAETALANAERDFTLNGVERNMIRSHMFPLNPVLPRCRESLLLALADKLSTVEETAGNGGGGRFSRKARQKRS